MSLDVEYHSLFGNELLMSTAIDGNVRHELGDDITLTINNTQGADGIVHGRVEWLNWHVTSWGQVKLLVVLKVDDRSPRMPKTSW